MAKCEWCALGFDAERGIWLHPAQQSFHAVDAEHGGMLGFGDETADGLLDVERAQERDFGVGFAGDQFGERTTGGDGCGAAADLIADLGHLAVGEEGGKAENVATGGVGDLDDDGGRGQFADVAGIAKMIEKLF